MFYRNHNRVSFSCGEELITKQSHKQECDIYNILKQYQKTGIINHINTNKPEYIQLPSDIDYQTSLNLLNQADQAFSSLPAKIRDHFSNDPASFLSAFSDPAQVSYLRELGLLNPEPLTSPAAPLEGG